MTRPDVSKLTERSFGTATDPDADTDDNTTPRATAAVRGVADAAFGLVVNAKYAASGKHREHDQENQVPDAKRRNRHARRAARKTRKDTHASERRRADLSAG